tara:strand:- start:233103 stop:234062 length:960 start_codon:yes stop_codon:yes gene_type:complete
MKNKINIGIFDGYNMVHNILTNVTVTIGETDFFFTDSKRVNVMDSEPLLDADVLVVGYEDINGYFNFRDLDIAIPLTYHQKGAQQHYIKKTLGQLNLKHFTYIPTFSLNYNFRPGIKKAMTTFNVDEVLMKPCNSAMARNVKVMKLNDPILDQWACKYRDVKFRTKVLGDEGKRTSAENMILQPRMNLLREWRVIWMGDDEFIVAERNFNSKGFGTTNYSGCEYVLLDKDMCWDGEMGYFDMQEVFNELRVLLEAMKDSPFRSIDLGLTLVNKRPKFVVIEHQYQFGDTMMSWDIRDHITKRFIEKMVMPKLDELGIKY